MASEDSREAQAMLIDPFHEPEPAEETGLNSHFGNTMAAKPLASSTVKPVASSTVTPVTRGTHSPRSSLSSNNPFRDNHSHSPPAKAGPSVSERAIGGGHSHRSPNYREQVPNYREQAFGGGAPTRRRGSSLSERYPGDESHKPLEIVRRESKKAAHSPHLNKRHLPGADMIDRLDPAMLGRAYHHEGPYDAASLARNTGKNAPIAALKTSNEETLKATPSENIKDAVERHKPLDGVALVPPGESDQFGRTYNYEEGTDMMREPASGDAGYKRWPGQEYDPEDLKGQAEPAFSLDRALRAHKIDDDGIEMEDHAGINRAYHQAERKGTLDARDPVEIAGGDRQYAALEHANISQAARDEDSGVRRSGSLVGGLKKRIGSIRHRHRDD